MRRSLGPSARRGLGFKAQVPKSSNNEGSSGAVECGNPQCMRSDCRLTSDADMTVRRGYYGSGILEFGEPTKNM